MHIFLVGAGALGCEFIKNFALMGIATGAQGEVRGGREGRVALVGGRAGVAVERGAC